MYSKMQSLQLFHHSPLEAHGDLENSRGYYPHPELNIAAVNLHLKAIKILIFQITIIYIATAIAITP